MIKWHSSQSFIGFWDRKISFKTFNQCIPCSSGHSFYRSEKSSKFSVLIFCAHVISNKGFWRPSEVESQDNKKHSFLTRMSLNHGKLLVWNVSIWVQWPCRTDLCQFVIITFQYDIMMRFDLVRALMFSGGKLFLSLLIKPAALRNQISIHCNSWNWPELKFCWSRNKIHTIRPIIYT